MTDEYSYADVYSMYNKDTEYEYGYIHAQLSGASSGKGSS